MSSICKKAPATFMRRAISCVSPLLLVVVASAFVVGAFFMGTSSPVRGEDGFVFPSFRDPNQRIEKPSEGIPPTLRFLLTDDFWPFSYLSPTGELVGFNVDLAREICVTIDVRCFLQVRPWDTLQEAVQTTPNAVIMAGLAINANTQRTYRFSNTYFMLPAHFMARKNDRLSDFSPSGLEGKKVSVVKGSAHEAYLSTFFRTVSAVPVETSQEAVASLAANDVDLVFGDGVRLLGLVVEGAEDDCCALIGGPYLDPAYFGNGLAIAVPRQDEELVQVLNYGLDQVERSGRFEDIFLRHFPINIF